MKKTVFIFLFLQKKKIAFSIFFNSVKILSWDEKAFTFFFFNSRTFFGLLNLSWEGKKRKDRSKNIQKRFLVKIISVKILKKKYKNHFYQKTIIINFDYYYYQFWNTKNYIYRKKDIGKKVKLMWDWCEVAKVSCGKIKRDHKSTKLMITFMETGNILGWLMGTSLVENIHICIYTYTISTFMLVYSLWGYLLHPRTLQVRMSSTHN